MIIYECLYGNDGLDLASSFPVMTGSLGLNQSRITKLYIKKDI